MQNDAHIEAMSYTILDVLTKAREMSAEDYLAWCDTIENIIGANAIFEGMEMAYVTITDGDIQCSVPETQSPRYSVVPVGTYTHRTGFYMGTLELRGGHLTSIYEPGAYVVGFDILAARSDGLAWAIYFGDMSEKWYQYNAVLPKATAEALYARCKVHIRKEDDYNDDGYD